MSDNVLLVIDTLNEQKLAKFDPDRQIVDDGQEEVCLTYKESTLLSVLTLERLGCERAIVSRETLIQHLWDDYSVVDRSTNLTQLVCTLRKKLTALLSVPVIEPVPRKGYRLTDNVSISDEQESSPLPKNPQMSNQKNSVRYKRSMNFVMCSVFASALFVLGLLFFSWMFFPWMIELSHGADDETFIVSCFSELKKGNRLHEVDSDVMDIEQPNLEYIIASCRAEME